MAYFVSTVKKSCFWILIHDRKQLLPKKQLAKVLVLCSRKSRFEMSNRVKVIHLLAELRSTKQSALRASRDIGYQTYLFLNALKSRGFKIKRIKQHTFCMALNNYRGLPWWRCWYEAHISHRMQVNWEAYILRSPGLSFIVPRNQGLSPLWLAVLL